MLTRHEGAASNTLALSTRRRRHHHIGFTDKMCDPVGFVQGVNREGGTSLALTPTAMASVNDERRSAQPIPQLATGASAFHDRVPVRGHGLQFLFSEVPEFVGNGITSSKCRRPITDRLPSEAITDYVNSSVGYPARPPKFAAGATSLIFESDDVVRRVRHFPAAWRDLDAAALIALNQGV